MHSRIFRFIESLQMTQSDFASKTGISPSALTQLKNNAGNLSIDNVIKIKKAFPNISLDWLISGDGEMYEKINDSQSPSLFPDFVDNTAKQEITPVSRKTMNEPYLYPPQLRLQQRRLRR